MNVTVVSLTVTSGNGSVDSKKVAIAVDVCKEMEGSDVVCVLPTAFYSKSVSFVGFW